MDTTAPGDYVEHLCLTYEGQLVNYLSQMLGSEEQARRVAQESFAALHAAYLRDRLHFPRAALFKIATNFALMELRRRRTENGALLQFVAISEEVADPRIGPDRQAMAEQVSQHIATAIRELRPPLRNVFVMAHVQGLHRTAIAAALGISVRRVDKRMTKALRACRNQLASHGIHLTDVLSLVAMVDLVCMLGSR
jgi:RNA polymerase sigma factor (sigma-70 family)